MVDEPQPQLSVVVGFKDWGRDRVLLAVKSLRRSFGELSGEVIISDYGSVEPGREAFAKEIEELGGRYVFTNTDGVWSRSRALNAGFAESRGRVLISTDADMLFSEGSLGIVGRLILNDPLQAIVLQCRDLPEGALPMEFDGEEVDWSILERRSRLRPRWGMGGMMACSREAFLRVRGLDERMVIYGGEDIDFANRLRRAGLRLEWITDPRVRMYHMWHPPTRVSASASPEGKRAIERNSRIHVGDPSVMRNVRRWRHAPKDREVPVSVVISTHNRAKYLPDSINSVLAQTMGEFELIIVDDGSTDNTFDVVSSYDDDRLRYFRRDRNCGLAAARNFAADVSRGTYTAIHDDDDIMLPWRLARHLESLTADASGSYGGWVDFDDETGELNPLHGKRLNLGSLLFAGKVYLHPTLMIETSILRRIRYDETLRSGSDYNLGIRLMRSGISLKHTGEFHTLRRLHPGQITESHGELQRTSAVLSTFMAKTPMGSDEIDALRKAQKGVSHPTVRGAENVGKLVTPFLPDRMVQRSAVGRLNSPGPDASVREWIAQNGSGYIRIQTLDGRVEGEYATFDDLTMRTLAEATSLGFDMDVKAVRRGLAVPIPASRHLTGLESVLMRNGQEFITDLWPELAENPYVFAFSDAPLDLSQFKPADGRQRVLTDDQKSTYVSVVSHDDSRALRLCLQRLGTTAGVTRTGVKVPSNSRDGETIAEFVRETGTDR